MTEGTTQYESKYTFIICYGSLPNLTCKFSCKNRVINLQFGLENRQKVYERDYISKEIMEKERANVNSLKRAITYVAQASALNTEAVARVIYIYIRLQDSAI